MTGYKVEKGKGMGDKCLSQLLFVRFSLKSLVSFESENIQRSLSVNNLPQSSGREVTLSRAL